MKNIKESEMKKGLTCHLIYCLLIHKPYSMSHRDEDFDRYWMSAKQKGDRMAKNVYFVIKICCLHHQYMILVKYNST